MTQPEWSEATSENPYLLINSKNGFAQYYRLNDFSDNEIVIGTDPENSINLNDANVHPFQVVIRREQGRYYLYECWVEPDLPTLFNSRKISARPNPKIKLHHTNFITFGDYFLTFLSQGDTIDRLAAVIDNPLLFSNLLNREQAPIEEKKTRKAEIKSQETENPREKSAKNPVVLELTPFGVTYNNQLILIRKPEHLKALECLIKKSPNPCTYAELYAFMYPEREAFLVKSDMTTLHTAISKLRKILAEGGVTNVEKLIENITNLGYLYKPA